MYIPLLGLKYLSFIHTKFYFCIFVRLLLINVVYTYIYLAFIYIMYYIIIYLINDKSILPVMIRKKICDSNIYTKILLIL